jgi:UDP-glucose 4-epimerase
VRLSVTGASGFIGQATVARLVAAGHSVRAVDRHPHRFEEPVDAVVGDLRDPEVAGAAAGPGTQAVVHLAAATSVLASVSRPAEVFADNVVATSHLLEAARGTGVARVVLASTNAVVGRAVADRISESSPLAPLTPYGATKAAAEMLASAYSSCYGMAVACLRFTNVYGPGMATKDSVVARLMRAARDRGEVQIYGDGTQVRDYLFVDDAVAAIELALERGHSGPLTVGFGESVSMNQLHRLACEVTGVDIPARRVPARAGEMPAVEVDTSLARSLGFRPAVSLREGLAATWAYFCSLAGEGSGP